MTGTNSLGDKYRVGSSMRSVLGDGNALNLDRGVGYAVVHIHHKTCFTVFYKISYLNKIKLQNLYRLKPTPLESGPIRTEISIQP